MRIMGDIDFDELENFDEKLAFVLEAVKATKENKSRYIQTIKNDLHFGGMFKITFTVPDESMVDDAIDKLLPYAIFMNTFKEFSNVLVEFLSEIKDKANYKEDVQIDKILEILRDLS